MEKYEVFFPFLGHVLSSTDTDNGNIEINTKTLGLSVINQFNSCSYTWIEKVLPFK